MRSVIKELLEHGEQIEPSKGPASEITGVLLELTNPRARLSRTETRGKPLSCLGELCWYLAKTNDLAFISYYIPVYKRYADGDVIFGGYGPRLFAAGGINQVANVIKRLRKRPDTRQAVIQLFQASDLTGAHNDIPCTCTLQFMLRRDALHMFTNMRSNDAFRGMPHDIFAFTMLQEIIARSLTVKLGTYKHAVGSLHLYHSNRKAAGRYLEEGWQSTISMPPMPSGDPWVSVTSLLEAESAIRTGESFDAKQLDYLDPYWADLVRLLQLFRYYKDKNAEAIRRLREKLSSNVYRLFVDAKLDQIN
ncbi:MAG: thymidylate synthase [bacterium]|nr:thymidylate synthase [bacterium]